MVKSESLASSLTQPVVPASDGGEPSGIGKKAGCGGSRDPAESGTGAESCVAGTAVVMESRKVLNRGEGGDIPPRLLREAKG